MELPDLPISMEIIPPELPQLNVTDFSGAIGASDFVIPESDQGVVFDVQDPELNVVDDGNAEETSIGTVEAIDVVTGSVPAEASEALDLIETTVGESVEGTRTTKIDDDGNIIISGETHDGDTYEFKIEVSLDADGETTMVISGEMAQSTGFESVLLDDVTISGELDVGVTVDLLNERFADNGRISEPYEFDSFNVEIASSGIGFEHSLTGQERTIARDYEDGSVVETVVLLDDSASSGNETAVAVTITDKDGNVKSYTKQEASNAAEVDVWVNDSTGQRVLLPGTFSETTSEYVLDGVETTDAASIRKDYDYTDDPSDDTTVTSVVATDTTDPALEDTYDAYVVTLDDGTVFTVHVENSAALAGETTASVATAFAENVATLPPAFRDTASEMPLFVNGIEGEEGRLAWVSGHNTEAEKLTFRVDVVMDVEGASFGYNLADFQDIMIHESGHLVEDVSRRGEWLDAINSDTGSPSVYGATNIAEDYAETFSLWYRVRTNDITGEEAAEIEAQNEHRFAVLDDSPDAVAMLGDGTDTFGFDNIEIPSFSTNTGNV